MYLFSLVQNVTKHVHFVVKYTYFMFLNMYVFFSPPLCYSCSTFVVVKT